MTTDTVLRIRIRWIRKILASCFRIRKNIRIRIQEVKYQPKTEKKLLLIKPKSEKKLPTILKILFRYFIKKINTPSPLSHVIFFWIRIYMLVLDLHISHFLLKL